MKIIHKATIRRKTHFAIGFGVAVVVVAVVGAAAVPVTFILGAK